jgi:hypothetical protein
MRLICYVCLIVGAVLLFADRIDRRGDIRSTERQLRNDKRASAKLLSQIYFYFQFSVFMIFSHFRNFLSPVLEGVAAIRKPIDIERMMNGRT